jgi:hypothetical protein
MNEPFSEERGTNFYKRKTLMRGRWRWFALWALILLGLAIFANWPRDGGSLIPDLVWAGFPWTFAHWESGRLISLNLLALSGDIIVNLGLIAAIAFACAVARARGPNSGTDYGANDRQNIVEATKGIVASQHWFHR